MKYSRVYLAAAECVLPDNVVTSAQIEQRLKPVYDRLGLPEGRLELMSGIRERRFWDAGMRPSAAAILAGKKAIAASGLPVEKLGALFHSSVCRDFLEPATANVVHHGLGLPSGAMIFDVSNACLGALNAMVIMANMIELGQVEAGIIVAGEMGETLVNGTIDALLSDKSITRKSIKSAFASLTIGSGAAAVVLANERLAPQGHRLLGGVARCDTSEVDLCKSDVDQGFSSGSTPLMNTDSERLLLAGCKLAGETWADFMKEMGWTPDSVQKAATHQVGRAHKKLLYETVKMDEAKDFPTLEFMGNVGSVSLPASLAIGAQRGHFTQGDNVALMGIGSGLNCMMLGLRW
ncbi:MAG: 3-oxoacyl-ACP synthase III [Nitrospinota bacterium]|nr:3-oxoacyl-ACP synthase III [Nitrospinota bacterium]